MDYRLSALTIIIQLLSVFCSCYTICWQSLAVPQFSESQAKNYQELSALHRKHQKDEWKHTALPFHCDW